MIKVENGDVKLEGLVDDVAVEIGLIVSEFSKDYEMRHSKEETKMFRKALINYLSYAICMDDEEERSTKKC